MIVNKTVGLVINFSISNFHVFNFSDLFFNFIKYFFDIESIDPLIEPIHIGKIGKLSFSFQGHN